ENERDLEMTGATLTYGPAVLFAQEDHIYYFHQKDGNRNAERCVFPLSALNEKATCASTGGTAVEDVQHIEEAGVLVCRTSSKDCFVVSLLTSKIVHQWAEVKQHIIGDFLQCGGQQLLLLFEGWSQQQPGTSYLLTDLKGLVVDRRPTATAGQTPPEHSSTGHLRHAFGALQAQNQAIARGVAEEEQRLKTKWTFAADTWLKLQHLDLGPSTGLPQPEIPLTPLLCPCSRGEDQQQTAIGRGKVKVISNHLHDIQATSVWHMIIGGTCVIGVKISNTSERDLRGLNLILSAPSSESPLVHHQLLSTTSTVWRCCQLPFATRAVRETEDVHLSRAKCQKLDHQVYVQQINVVHPTDTATITCSFPAPSLSVFSQVEYLVHLQLPCPAGNQSAADGTNQAPSGLQESSRTDTEGSRGEDASSPESKEAKDGTVCRMRQKFLFCGKVTLTVSEILEQDMSSQLEEAVIALSATQQSWNLHVSFVLHEAAVLPDCFLRAGMVYHPHLDHYICSEASPPCLNLARVRLVSDKSLLSREARLMAFARDPNQLLLLLQHLYRNLPDDANIVLSDAARHGANLKNLTAAISTELGMLKRRSTAVLQAHRGSHSNSKQQERREHSEETGLPGVEISRSEAEDFAIQQKRYKQSHSELVSENESENFFAVMNCCALETDAAVGRL
ncbi:hypothetical protein BaRGS_00031319, partial [Batillaria attramentaria]